jgi:hypothetical protein
LADRLEGYGHVRIADPDGRRIRVGFLSRLSLLDVGQVELFPAPFLPVQVDDTDAGENAMGRPALVAGVETEQGMWMAW